MSTYTLPNTPLFCPQELMIQAVGNVHVNVSPMNGATKTVEFPGDRWMFTLRYGPHHNADMAALRAFWNRFRGAAHVLRMWNLAQPEPLGTMRGTPTVLNGKAAGAQEIDIARTDGNTSLLPGDWIGLTLNTGDVQTVEVVESIVLVGGLTVDFNPPLRQQVLSGSAIIWQRPHIDFLLTAPPVIPHGAGARHQLGLSDGFSVECVEFVK